MTWRRLLVLIDHLPRESATVQALGGERAEWGSTDHLLATIVDAVQQLTWVTASVHSAKGKRPKRPDPFPRPGRDVSRRAGEGRRFGSGGRSPDEMRRILDAWGDEEATGLTYSDRVVHVATDGEVTR